MAEPDSLYLSIGLPDGTERRFNPDPPRDGFRLAVGSVNRRSSIWRVWAAGDEVYITVTGLNKTRKLSLHKSEPGGWLTSKGQPNDLVQLGSRNSTMIPG